MELFSIKTTPLQGVGLLPAAMTEGGKYFRFSSVYLQFKWVRRDSRFISEQFRESYALEMPQYCDCKLPMRHEQNVTREVISTISTQGTPPSLGDRRAKGIGKRC